MSKVTEHQEVVFVTPSSGHLGQCLRKAVPALGRRAGETVSYSPSPLCFKACWLYSWTTGTKYSHSPTPSLFYKVLRHDPEGGTKPTPPAQKQKGSVVPHTLKLGSLSQERLAQQGP